jgi:flagellar biosynthesis/type III secretory pathway protein FliH
VLHVSPGDAGRVRERWGPAVAVREDPGVSPGGVWLETDGGELDARLEAQLEALRAVLEPEGEAGGDGGGGADGRAAAS